jgi:hypothetical protein
LVSHSLSRSADAPSPSPPSHSSSSPPVQPTRLSASSLPQQTPLTGRAVRRRDDLTANLCRRRRPLVVVASKNVAFEVRMTIYRRSASGLIVIESLLLGSSLCSFDQAGLLLQLGLRAVLVEELEELGRSVLVEGVGELGGGCGGTFRRWRRMSFWRWRRTY